MNKPRPIQHGLLLLMRVTLVNILITSFTVVMAYAVDSKAQEVLNRKVTIDVEETEVKDVLVLLSKQAKVKFTYNPRQIPVHSKVSFRFTNARLADVLSSLLNASIDYKVIGNQIALRSTEELSQLEESNPQEASAVPLAITVSGKVTDVNGNVLPGVSILVKGTTVGTSSDTDGKYVINVPDENAVLLFSFIGFAQQEVAVSNQTTLDIVLLEDISQLGEVVVTAFGIEKEKKKLGYSVTEVKGDAIQTTREPAFMNALTGKIAGVVVQSPNAGPGSSTRVVIRGNATFGNNRQPLYVIDGVPIDNTYRGANGNQSTNDGKDYGGQDPGDGLSNLNPDDVESISVLKGVGAAALYGQRAQNGVILITTKKGKNNQDLGITFNSNTVFETMVPYTEKDMQYTYGRGSTINGVANQVYPGAAPGNYANALSWGAKFGSVPTFVDFDGITKPYVAQTMKENFKRLFDTGLTTTNSLAFAGGSDKSTYRLSFSDTHNKSPQPNIGYDRYNVALRVTSDVGKRLHTDLKIDLSRTDKKLPLLAQDGRGAVGHVFSRLSNTTDIRDLDQKNADGDYLYQYFNPYVQFEKVSNKDRRDRIISALNLKYDVASFLNVTVQGGADVSNGSNTFVVRPYKYPNDQGFGDLKQTNQTIEEDNIMAMLNFNKEIGNFSISANLGTQGRLYRFTSLSQSGSYFTIPDFADFSNTNSDAQHPVTYSRSVQQKKVNSFFGAAQFGYKNFLFAEVTARQDWSSALAKVQAGTYDDGLLYGSANLSYVFTEHINIAPNILNSGKLRVAYGTTGSDTDPGQNDLQYKLNYTVNGQPVATINNPSLPPATVVPEKTSEIEIGTQLAFFKNLLNVDFAWYNKTTKDFLLNSQVSNTTGFSSVRTNGGSMRNRGFELLVSSTPVNTGDFSWDVSVNMAHNANKVLTLNDDLAKTGVVFYSQGSGSIAAHVGDSFGSIYGVPYRVGPNGEEIWKASGNGGVIHETGRVTYDAEGNPLKDANGTIIIDNNVKLGSANPTLTGGITNTIKYKAISLGFLIDASFGASVYSLSNRWANFFGNSAASLKGRDGDYIPSGSINTSADNNNPVYATNTVAFNPYEQYNSNNPDQQNVFKNEFIKLRQVSLGYSLPKDFLSKMKIKAATFSLIARNLFYFRKTAPLIDPNSSDSIGSSYGFEQGALPASRTYGFNFNIQF